MSRPATQSDSPPEHLRVLIADDVTETRRSTRLMLSLVPGAEVVAIARNGREAVELNRQHRPDLALMDVNMPEMNGLTAIRAMMDERPDLACIVISAERDAQTLLEAITVGARGYLTKPYTAEQLLEAVRRAMYISRGGRQPVAAPTSPAPANQEALLFRQQRDRLLMELANEYLRQRRTDKTAMEVLELLSQNPQCDPRYLTFLAMIYALNQEWAKLKALSAYLETMPHQ